MTFDKEAKYQDSHEWIRREGGNFVCGISDYAQDSLGDIVFVEFPELGTKFKKGDSFGVVESVKAASDVYMPIDGEIVDINNKVEENTEIVNQDPFGDGWLIKIKPSDSSQVEDLMTADKYEEYTKTLD
jgi:glycine cleavage system H protein